MKYFSFIILVILFGCATTVHHHYYNNTQEEKSESIVPVNIEIETGNLPSLNQVGTIVFKVTPLVSSEKFEVIFEIPPDLDVITVQNWTGMVEKNITREFIVEFKPTAEMVYPLQARFTIFLQDKPYIKNFDVLINVTNRGTFVEDVNISSILP